MKITDAIQEFILYKQSLGMSYKDRALKRNAFARCAGPIEIDSVGPEAVRRFLDGDRPVTTEWFNKFSTTVMAPLIAGRQENNLVFLNRYGSPMTRFEFHTLVERHSRRAAEKVPSLTSKRVSPLTIRHTTATHLLRAGVDINTIRAWLGHVSVDTTNVYAEVDLEMKAKALAACDTGGKRQNRKMWRTNPRVMEFLRSL